MRSKKSLCFTVIRNATGFWRTQSWLLRRGARRWIQSDLPLRIRVLFVFSFVCLALFGVGFLFLRSAPPDTITVPQGVLRGLEGVAIDDWLERFSKGPAIAERVRLEEGELLQEIALALKGPAHERLSRIYGFLLQSAARNYSTKESHLEVAHVLLSVREAVRIHRPVGDMRPILYLLSVLSEETLYAATLKFRSLPAFWRFAGAGSDLPCEDGARAERHYGVGVCEGDVVLSKGEEFSAALSLFRSPFTATFSHSGFALRGSGTDQVGLLEAEGTWGGLSAIDEEDPPARMSVYRARPDPGLQGGAGVKKAIARARSLIPVTANPQDPATKENRAFQFNYSLNPTCRRGAYFCSELIHCLYRDSGVAEDRNPFARELWSETLESTDEFIGRIWKVYWGAVPTPGDVELSAAHELVEHSVFLSEIPNLRIQQQVLESLLRLLREDPKLREGYVESLTAAGESRLSEMNETTRLLAERLSGLRRSQLVALERDLPAEARLPEVLFYYHVQHRLLPEVEAKLMKAADAAGSSGISIGSLQSLAAPALRAGIREFQREVASLRTAGRALSADN